eukprot:scaffold41910_cov30-Attheya_sp.AAC.3
MVSTWVPLVQIKTASIGDDSGGSRSKNDPCTAIDWIPGGWQPLFRHSNSTSCLVRMAASVIDYEKCVKEFAKDHSVKEIAYEDYLKD